MDMNVLLKSINIFYIEAYFTLISIRIRMLATSYTLLCFISFGHINDSFVILKFIHEEKLQLHGYDEAR